MKRILITIVAISLMASVTQAKNLSAWLVGGYDNTLTARVLYDLNPNISVGGEVSFFKLDDLPGNAGLCGIYKFPDAVSVPNPFPVGPATLTGTPYAGARAGVDITNSGTYSGLLAGIIVQDVIVVEYWMNTNTDFKLSGVDADSEQMVFAGLVIPF